MNALCRHRPNEAAKEEGGREAAVFSLELGVLGEGWCVPELERAWVTE